MSKEIDGLEITPQGKLSPIRTELPDAKPVKTIEGRPIEEWERDFKRNEELVRSLTPDEEKKALKAEAELLDARNEEQDRLKGNTPLRLVAKYKMQIGIFSAIAAAATLLMKC